ncbi:response regulator [Luteolibacter yonseiensis]|uniref:histidine kinase n=1 Tax=Luteolibacter yonseiensis TaxID=1144680 RepID=A0A934R898_9BACT|nr:response regulator [Luteolibacter yonseiensis]MBK1817753.1 response regulator [Luteolibacter yonseiensis]
MTYHPLLARQLRRVFGSSDTVPPEVLPFIKLVDGAYAQFDSDRLLTEHVMTVSARELTESNATLIEQNNRNAEVLQRLEKAINLLNDDESGHRGGLDLLQVAHDIEQLAELRRDTENALRSAKVAADSANRAKSEFLANMSHEIRTPLNAVVGMTSLLLDSEMSPDQLDYTETIRASSDALLSIINDILDFSKIEAGKMEVECIPTDIHTTVEQVIDMFSAQTSAQMLDLGAFISPEVPRWVNSDPTRLRQILVNLVGNAIRFTPQGGIGIFVSAMREEDKWNIRFHVEDTGIGIPAERLDRLFKAFTQVDSSTTRRFGGTGLGLAISQRLVSMLGGEISVTSEPGEGTTFHFDIRAEAVGLNELRPPQQLDIRPLAGRHILIVDDIAINRRILEQQLRGAGFVVTLAPSPQAAIEFFLLGNSCDLVLLDYNMPVMNGAELALELDRRHPRSLPPFILLSSRGHLTDEAGPLISRRLAKPVKPSELLSLISETLLPTSHIRVPTRAAPEYDTSFANKYPLKILVAEDIAVNQKVISLFLTRLGYRADIVADGLEVLAAHAAGNHDIILMDLQMPEMDGVAATRMLRTNPNGASRPYIIALTANVQSEQQIEAREVGFQDYLSKPLRPESLANALERAHIWLMANP